MKFLADRMLGKLARLLRMAGLDVVYVREGPGPAIAARAAREGRLFLTRDTNLVGEGAAGPYLFVEDNNPYRQLCQVAGELGLDLLAGAFTRCLDCNEPLLPADKDALAEAVPPYVWSTQEEFHWCPECRRVFWAGTHRERMREALGAAMRGAETAAVVDDVGDDYLTPE